jgi:ferredoxin
MPELDDNIPEQNQDAPASERILFFPEPCTRLHGDSCNRCAAVCPVQAIAFTDENVPRIDDASCTRCGICIGVCDSFASSSITTLDYARRMVRKAGDGKRIYLCCNEDVFDSLEPADNVFVLGCLSALSPEFITYLLSSGNDVVLCHELAYCEGCKTGGTWGGKLWQRACSLAEEWSGRELSSSDVIPEVVHLADTMAQPDRRTLFTGAIGALGEVASGEYRARKSTVIDDFLARQERMRASLRATTIESAFLDDDSRESARRSRFARKILLGWAIDNDPAIAERAGLDPNSLSG